MVLLCELTCGRKKKLNSSSDTNVSEMGSLNVRSQRHYFLRHSPSDRKYKGETKR